MRVIPTPRRHARLLTASLLSVAALSACSNSSSNRSLFESGGPIEVGATQFAVTSVTPWSRIERDLQPDFFIDENMALLEVLPSSLYSDEQRTTALQVGISAGDTFGSGGQHFSGNIPSSVPIPRAVASQRPAHATTSVDASPSSDTPQKNGSSTGSSGRSGNSRGESSGDRSADSSSGRSGSRSGSSAGARSTDDTEAAPSNQTSSRASAPSAAPPNGHDDTVQPNLTYPVPLMAPVILAPAPQQTSPRELGVEPQLRYSLATSLLQSVRLLNHYVHDVVNREDCDAYVVRLQISLMPLRRTAQYDTYVDVSFLNELASTPGGDEAPEISVVPLLSTDSLEGIIKSSSTSDLKELALSLQASANGAGGGLNANKLSQIFKQISGRDVNSLLTMGQVNPNTIRVRLGAQAEPTGQYVMVPRTYNVPVVLMVKRGPAGNRRTVIRAVSKTIFVNALSGKLLQGRTNLAEVVKLPEIANTYVLLRRLNLKPAELLQLSEYAVLGDINDFTRFVRGRQPDVTTAEIGRYWLEALSLRATDAVQKLTFTLPATAPPRMPPADQTASLVDDGTRTVVSLFGGNAVDRLSLTALLDVGAEPKNIRFYAVDAPAITSDGRGLTFTFPSLAAAGIDLAVGPVPASRVLLRLTTDSGQPSTDSPAESAWNVVHLGLPTNAASTQSVAGDQALIEPKLILADDAFVSDPNQAGTVAAVFEVPPDYAANYQFDVLGADIDSVEPADGILKKVDGKWIVKGSGKVTLSLSHAAGPSLEFHLTDPAGHGKGSTRELLRRDKSTSPRTKGQIPDATPPQQADRGNSPARTPNTQRPAEK